MNITQRESELEKRVRYERNEDNRRAIGQLARYIRDMVGEQDWADHIDIASGYVAPVVNMTEHDVNSMLRRMLDIETLS